MLPDENGKQIGSLWHEYEAAKRIVQQVDALQVTALGGTIAIGSGQATFQNGVDGPVFSVYQIAS